MRNKYLKIIPGAYVLTYIAAIDKFNPTAPNKFPVVHQPVYSMGSKKA